MITDELLNAYWMTRAEYDTMTREEYERNLQQLRELAEQFRVHMKEN